MTTPIRPSLSQMLTPQAPVARPAEQPAQGGGFASALAAQKSFFQQVTQPRITPATYTAAEINRAQPMATPSPVPTPSRADDNQPLKRPGSYLNIVI